MATWLEALSDNIAVDKTKCTFCAECVDKCICDNLRFKASPCREACPLRMNCHGYVQLIARGQEDRALSMVWESTPFPGILGRVCSAPCEDACTRRNVDGQAVAVRALKRYLAELGGSQEYSEFPWRPGPDRPERVAIVGGGPAGAMAACWLRREGYQVALFEAAAHLGGMLINCVPEFRLPGPVAAEEMSLVERLGVEVHLSAAVDAAALGKLTGEYDAVLLAAGAARGKPLGVPREDLPGVYGGLEFLRSVRAGTPLPIGKVVMVIGGGNTAIDVAQMAHRLGAEHVQVVCLEARSEMPAFPWEVADALEEGVLLENGWGPVEFEAEEGRLSAVRFRKCVAVFDEEGRFAPRFDADEHWTVMADTVIVAIGQESDLGFLEGSGVEVRGGRIVVDPVSLQTSVPRLFAAGDAAVGSGTIVAAMAQGRTAAESIHRYLQGMPLRYGRRDQEAAVVEAEIDTTGAIVRPRVQPPRLAVSSRRSFAEIEGTVSREQALAEAERCVSCGEPWGKHRTCWSCLVCEVVCPEDAIEVKVPFLMR